MAPSRTTRSAGFTLIEVLVALVILAVALAAAVRASGIATDGAIDDRERLLALWVAQNHIAGYASGQPFPPLGDRSGQETQYDTVFTWRESVSGTANPYFRRVEVRVYSPRRPDYAVARLIGHVAQKPQ